MYARRMRILVMVGGTNEPSNSRFLADRFAEGIRLQEPSAIVETLLLKDLALPHFTIACYRSGLEPGDAVLALWEAVRSADGVVIASPVWNFSVPAHLKNAIDLLGCKALDAETRSKGQLRGKPFFFIFTGGAPTAVWKGVMRFTTSHIPESIRYYGGSIVGKHYEARCMPSQREFGLVVDRRAGSLLRVERRGRAFAQFVGRVKETGKLPLGYRVRAAMYQWGQRMVARLP